MGRTACPSTCRKKDGRFVWLEARGILMYYELLAEARAILCVTCGWSDLERGKLQKKLNKTWIGKTVILSGVKLFVC